MQERWTRRQVLSCGGAAVAAALGLAGLAGYAWPHGKSSDSARPSSPDPATSAHPPPGTERMRPRHGPDTVLRH